MAFFSNLDTQAAAITTATTESTVTIANTLRNVTAMAEVSSSDALTEQLNGRTMAEVRSQNWG